MDKISTKIYNMQCLNSQKDSLKADVSCKSDNSQKSSKLSGELNSLAFCGKVQVLSQYETKRREKEAFDEYLKINKNSKTSDIKKLLENPYLKDVHRASLENILSQRNIKGGFDNPYEIDLSNGNNQYSSILEIYSKDDKKVNYYRLTDTDTNTDSKDEESDNGILKEHADSFFTEILKDIQHDENYLADFSSKNYNKYKDSLWGEKSTILGFLDDISCEKLNFDKDKKIKDLFPTEKDYADAVINKINSMMEEEKAYLDSLPELKDEHIFYRGLFDTGLGSNLNNNIDDWQEGDVVIPQFNPMFVSTDITTAQTYLKENSNKKARLLRIKTPKGAKIPYSKGRGSESIFPAKSKFKYLGTDKVHNLEVINLEYLNEN